jgi:hypothetical protein
VLAFCGKMLGAMQNMGPFPKDVLRLVLMLLDSCDDLHRCQITCKSWKSALFDRLFDQLQRLERWRAADAAHARDGPKGKAAGESTGESTSW